MRGVYERGNGYQVKRLYTKINKRVTGTFTTKEEAVAFLAACDLAIVQGKPLPDPKGAGSTKAAGVTTIRALYEDTLLMHWRSNRSSASAENGMQFVQWVGPATPVKDAFAKKKLDEYTRYRLSLGNAGGTVNKKLSAVRMMQKRAVEMDLMEGIVPMVRQKPGAGRERYYTVAEERAIIDLTRELGLREWADFWKFLTDTGARPGEARQLLWSDFRGGMVTIRKATSKASPTRTLDLTKAATEAVKNRQNDPKYTLEKGPFSFATKGRTKIVWDKLRAYLPWLASEDTIPYTFRHTFGSRMAMSGKGALELKHLMGHSTVTMTERYVHLNPFAMKGATAALENFQDPGIG